MDLKLHANATTTPRPRAYIEKSQASNAALARALGIHSRTVAGWKARREIVDRSTRPHRLTTALSEGDEGEEGLIVELRRSLALPLDDLVEAMHQPRVCRAAPRHLRPPQPATSSTPTPRPA